LDSNRKAWWRRTQLQERFCTSDGYPRCFSTSGALSPGRSLTCCLTFDLRVTSQGITARKRDSGLQIYRMFWKLAIPAILAWTLFVSIETKKLRPQGAIPSPYKLKGNDLSSPSHTLASLPQHTSARRQKGKHDMLSSSREALVVTERKYLKSDWCKTQPLRQTVSLEGCLSRTVINRFCYGQCNSFYIPRHLTSQTSHRSRKTASAPDHNTSFQSCAFCRPSRITTVTVRLHCPGLQPPYRQRKVQRIKQCKCVSVNVNAAY
ncbi:hypothetical protein QQF64_010955, partial [Cirrhinus molitorella]